MATHRNELYMQRNSFDEQLCQKISMAIKRSNIFVHITPSDLIRKRYSANIDVQEDFIPLKKHKVNRENISDSINDSNSSKENICRSPNVFMNDAYPRPDTMNLQSTPRSQEITVKAECVVNTPLNIPEREMSVQIINKEHKMFNQNNIPKSNIQNCITNKYNVPDCREKQNKNLSNLAASLLPLPTQLFGKDSMISALETGNYNDFMIFFKEGLQIENEISPDDLFEIFEKLIQGKAFLMIPEFISVIKHISIYIDALCNCYIKYHDELNVYKNDIIECIESMVDFNINSNINLFIMISCSENNWNKMWTLLMLNRPDYIIPEKYFNSCMTMIQNLGDQQSILTNETLLNIINYINRNYPSQKTSYMADIWFYCIYHDINSKDSNSEIEYEAPQYIIEKVMDKLNSMNDPSFIFGMKLLSKNWSLIFNQKFCEWFSKLISNKSDVRKCLFAINDSIHALTRNSKQDIYDNFYLLAIRVMSFLNKKSLYTCSKNVYETFLKSYFLDIKRALIKTHDKFKLKWTMVECLISSAEYEKALSVIKELEVLKDLETTSMDYNKVKEKLPNLVWHLINSSQLLPVIVLFEQVVSIFIFNESIDSAYTKNCNEIFDLIVIKAFESNDIDVVKKMISLLDLIISADIDFEISIESFRYLCVAAVRANVPFKELLDFVDTCYKFGVFDAIQTAEDGLGSFVDVHSSLTYEEIVLMITWMCRHIKINLVHSAQNQGSNIRENIMKVCSMKFILHRDILPDSFCKQIAVEMSFNQFLIKFAEAMNNPKYLAHPIKFSTVTDTSNEMKIVCDNRVVYNTIYYSDI